MLTLDEVTTALFNTADDLIDSSHTDCNKEGLPLCERCVDYDERLGFIIEDELNAGQAEYTVDDAMALIQELRDVPAAA